MTQPIPPMSEFIDLKERRASRGRRSGFEAIGVEATVAVYKTNTAANYSILTIRFSKDTAEKHRLAEQMRFSCHVHPDQQHIALRPVSTARDGAAMFRPKGSKALVYQTTLREGVMDAFSASGATVSDADSGALVVSLKS